MEREQKRLSLAKQGDKLKLVLREVALIVEALVAGAGIEPATLGL